MRTCLAVLALAAYASPQRQGTVDLAAAARTLPAAEPALAAHPDGAGYRRSPDGVRWAWLTLRTSAANGEATPPSLCVLAPHGAEARVDRCPLPDADDRIAPEWLPNGAAVLVVDRVTDDPMRSCGGIQRVEVATGAVSRVLRFEGWVIDCVDVAADGRRLAVMARKDVPGEPVCELRIVDGDGKVAQTFAVPGSWGYEAAASWSPDQERIAIATGAGLYFATAAGGEVRRCCDVPMDSILVGKPQWTKDGAQVLVAVGGGVVWARVRDGVAESWTEAQLGARVYAAALRPEAGVAALVSREEVEGGPLSLLRGAGHPSVRSYATVQLLALDSRERLPLGALRQEIKDRGRMTLPYLKGITELLQ